MKFNHTTEVEWVSPGAPGPGPLNMPLLREGGATVIVGDGSRNVIILFGGGG